jgi:hypothetical protein
LDAVVIVVIQAEMKAKHGIEIGNLQSDWENTLKRRVSEVQGDLMRDHEKARSADREIIRHLEARIAGMEREYVPRERVDEMIDDEINRLRNDQEDTFRELTISNRRELDQRVAESNLKITRAYEQQVNELKRMLFRFGSCCKCLM